MKIIYFGTPDIAANVLEYLLNHGVQIVAVVTKPDKPKGRSGTPVKTPVKLKALALNPSIPVYQPEIVSEIAFAPVLQKYEADLFVVVAYGEIIKQHLLDMPKLGCINLHASLLPKYRGAAPIQRAIMDGEVESGVTIMHMAKKMDAGDIIEMVRVLITPDMTAGELTDELFKVGSKALLDVINQFEKGVIKRIPQDEAEATFAPKVELEDCEIDWKMDAKVIHDKVRGSMPHPGSFCFVQVKDEKKRMKIKKTRVTYGLKANPGTILSADQDGIVVACGKDALTILELQLEGKKTMPLVEFLRGIPVDKLTF